MSLKIGDIGIYHVGKTTMLGVLVGFRKHRTFNCIVKFPGRDHHFPDITEDHYAESTVLQSVEIFKKLSG